MNGNLVTQHLPQVAHRILVMEDNVSLCRLFCRALSQLGVETIGATTLAEARQLLGAMTDLKLFICDMHMGKEHGHVLLREIAEQLVTQGTQVIIVSGEAKYRAFAGELGIEFFLEKPVSINSLITLVRRLLTTVNAAVVT
jgi:DNA-binding NtrC family response regulator